MMLNRQAIFDHEKIIRDDGAVCIGVGICSSAPEIGLSILSRMNQLKEYCSHDNLWT